MCRVHDPQNFRSLRVLPLTSWTPSIYRHYCIHTTETSDTLSRCKTIQDSYNLVGQSLRFCAKISFGFDLHLTLYEYNYLHGPKTSKNIWSHENIFTKLLKKLLKELTFVFILSSRLSISIWSMSHNSRVHVQRYGVFRLWSTVQFKDKLKKKKKK